MCCMNHADLDDMMVAFFLGCIQAYQVSTQRVYLLSVLERDLGLGTLPCLW